MTKPGRPYSEPNRELFTAICNAMQLGSSLRQACLAANVSKSTILEWVNKSAENIPGYEGLLDQYSRARDMILNNYEDDIHELSDVTDFNKPMIEPADRRTAIEAKKWLLSKLVPKKYGDRIVNEVVGANGGPLQVEDVSKSLSTEDLAAIRGILQKNANTDPKADK